MFLLSLGLRLSTPTTDSTGKPPSKGEMWSPSPQITKQRTEGGFAAQRQELNNWHSCLLAVLLFAFYIYLQTTWT